MTSVRCILCGLACFGLLPSGATVFASSASAGGSGQVSAADRAADDGLARLFDAVYGLQATRDQVTQSIAGLVAFLPEAEQALRTAVAVERQVGRPREVRPGVVAVEVSISTERLGQLLAAALQTPGANDQPRVGVDPAAGAAVVATGVAALGGHVATTAPGWRHCSQSDITLARMAAELDLRQRTLAWLRRVRLSTGQTVGLMARQYPAIEQALREQVERFAVGEPTFEPDGRCVLTCTITAEQLASLVARAMRAAGPGDSVRPEAPFELLTLRGISVPPLSPPQSVRAIQGLRPDWIDRVLSTTAAAAGPENEPADVRGRLAIAAARAEAKRQLWMELEQLTLPGGSSIAEAIAARPNPHEIIREINDAFVTGGSLVDNRGTGTVTVSVRLEAVWQILAR